VRYLPLLRRQVDRLSPPFDRVLLADDGSQDETASLAEQCGFEIIRLPSNRGPGGARNALAEAVDEEWIHFHDVDDELSSDYVNRVAPLLDSETDLLLHFTDFIDSQTRALHIRWTVDGTEIERDAAETLLRSPLPTMSSCIRRTQFIAVGGFNEQRRCFEDGDLHFRLALSQSRIRLLPEVLEISLRGNDGAGADQHYCFRCRLEFLEDYARDCPAHLHQAIAYEAERAAFQLLRFGNNTWAQRAVSLCHRLGQPVPTTAQPILRALRGVLPSLWVLRLQEYFRSNATKNKINSG